MNRQRIEPWELKEAIEEQLQVDELDYRTRMLILESAQVLRDKTGIALDCARVLPVSERGRRGFPDLEDTVGAITSPESINEFLRELGTRLLESAEITIGGSSALILQGLLVRQTRDVDVVDEVPAALRSLRFTSRTNLYIAHFQSHYLPEGWQDRRQSRGDFKKLRVYLVDGLDIYLGKMFSVREKDQSDLHYLKGHFDPKSVRHHLEQYGQKLASDPKLRKAAEDNWYILYGEELA